MEDVRTNSGQSLGVAALVVAIITFVLAVIPCVGLIAIIPGIIAVVLASVALSQASKGASPKGIMIAALIIAIIATLISFSQIFVAGKIAGTAGKWPKNFENIINDVQDNVIKELDDNNINIRVESDSGVVEINAHKKDKEKLLEGLEGADTLQNDTTRTSK